MRRALQALFLCLAILSGIVGTASGAYVDASLKNRVGVSEQNPDIHTYKLGSLEQEPQRGDTIIGYDSATGVLFYVNQNPFTFFDPLGLRKDIKVNDDIAYDVPENRDEAQNDLESLKEARTLNSALSEQLSTAKSEYGAKYDSGKSTRKDLEEINNLEAQVSQSANDVQKYTERLLHYDRIDGNTDGIIDAGEVTTAGLEGGIQDLSIAHIQLAADVYGGVGLVRGLSSRLFSAAAKGGVAAERQVLYHYTNQAGHAGITGSNSLNPSLKALSPQDVRYGNGQYLSDIVPGTKTPAQLSREFLNQPFQGQKYTHYIEIDVTGLGATQGRSGVWVVPNEAPLDLTGRILSSGKH